MSHTFQWCQDKTRLTIYDKQVFCINGYGTRRWWLNDKFHREDGPAIEYTNGRKWWYFNGKPHRENGPAVEYANGTKYWYLGGIGYSEFDYWKELQK